RLFTEAPAHPVDRHPASVRLRRQAQGQAQASRVARDLLHEGRAQGFDQGAGPPEPTEDRFPAADQLDRPVHAARARAAAKIGEPVNLSRGLEEILTRARKRAVEQRQALCDCEQVLYELLLAKDETRAAEPVAEYLSDRTELSFHPPDADFARALRTRAIPEAEVLAAEQGAAEVETGHLLQALLGPHSPVRETLREAVIRGMRSNERSAPAEPERSPVVEPGTRTEAVNLLTPYTPGPTLEYLVERPAELDRIQQTLLFGNPLLVGENGSGRR